MLLPDFRDPILLPFQVLKNLFASSVVFKILWVRPVIRDAGHRSVFIAAFARGKPLISDPEMIADPELHSMFLRRLLPHTDDVLTRPHVHGVPSVVLGIPQVEIVMMHPHTHE